MRKLFFAGLFVLLVSLALGDTIYNKPNRDWLTGSGRDPLWRWLKDTDNVVGGVKGTGKAWYVDSGVQHEGDGSSWEDAFNDIDSAINACSTDGGASRGDVIYVAQGHAETVVAGSGISQDIIGLAIKGCGFGDNRPKITFTTSTGASWLIGANDCVVSNIIFINGINSQIRMLIVGPADNATISNCEFRDGASTSGLVAIDIGRSEDGSADRCKVQNCTFYQPGGNNASAISILYDMVGIEITDNIIYGDFDNGGIYVPAEGDACLNLLIADNIITNKQASGKGISISGTSSTVVLGENTINVDTVGNAYSLNAAIVNGITAISAISADAGIADGTGVYPASVANDSLWAKVLDSGNPASAASYDNTTMSLRAIAAGVDAIVISGGTNIDANLAALLVFRGTADTNLATLITRSGTVDTNLATLITFRGTADTNLATLLTRSGTVDTNWTTLTTWRGTQDANIAAILADTGTTGVKIADGEIDAGAVADDAIDAGAIATDAIGSAEFAAAAVTKIWNNNISAFSGAGYAGTYLKTLYDDWLNDGRLDLLIDGIKAQTDIISDANTNAQADLDAILEDTGTTLNTLLTDANTNVTAILEDTTIIADANTNAQADLDAILEDTGTTLNTLLTDANTNVTAILEDTGTTLNTLLTDANTNITAILEDTTIIADANTNAQADLDAILEDTGTTLNDLLTDANTNAQADLDAILEDTGTTLNTLLTDANTNATAILEDTATLSDMNDTIVAILADTAAGVPQTVLRAEADMNSIDALNEVWFTVTGDVMVRIVGVVGATGITSTNGTTTLSVGTTEAPAGILAASTVDNTQFAATDVWVDATPTVDCEVMDAGVNTWHIIGGGEDIRLTISADDITAGTLTLYCWWKPLSANGSVTTAP